jgi:hypothetical protein
VTLLERSLAVDAEIGVSSARAWTACFLAFLYADRGDADRALAAARSGILNNHQFGDLSVVNFTLEWTAVVLSILGQHEPAATLYAIVDGGALGTDNSGPSGWQTDGRMRGRNLTLEVLGPDAIDEQRPRVATMTVADVVAFALTEIDAILARCP